MTRIRIKIAKTNAPAPRSMTSLITSGFSRSSRRKSTSLKYWRGGSTSHRFVPESKHGTFDATLVAEGHGEAIGVAV